MMHHNWKASEPLREGYQVAVPPPPEWTMRLVKNGDLQFHLADAPNWFHRLMQRIVLGITWERL